MRFRDEREGVREGVREDRENVEGGKQRVKCRSEESYWHNRNTDFFRTS